MFGSYLSGEDSWRVPTSSERISGLLDYEMCVQGIDQRDICINSKNDKEEDAISQGDIRKTVLYIQRRDVLA